MAWKIEKMSLFPRTTARPFRTVMLMALTTASVARRWEDVIAVSIYAQSHVDIARLQFSLEENPLFLVPTSPLLEESQPPSDAPSSVPSVYLAGIELETDFGQEQTTTTKCLEGESSYNIKKVDDWGEETRFSIRQVGEGNDGESDSTYLQGGSVDETTPAVAGERYSAFVLRSSMKGGDFDTQEICLSSSSCYEVELEGGPWQEARWEIVPVSFVDGLRTEHQDAIAKGSGFSNCTFHVTEETPGSSMCPFTCQLKEETNLSANDGVNEMEGASSNNNGNPLVVPEGSSSDLDALTTAPSNAPSDAPSLVPTL